MYRSLLDQSKQRYEEQRHAWTKHHQDPPPIPWETVNKFVEKMPSLKEDLTTYIKRDILRETPEITVAINSDICDECGVEMMVIANDSMLACSRCGKTRLITTVHAWNASMDADYSTINVHQKSRLLEWLECAQAKEYGDIPEAVLQDVMATLVRNRLTGLEEYIPTIAEERLNGPFTCVENALARLSSRIPELEHKLKSVDAILVRNVLRGNSSESKKYAEKSAKIASLVSGYYPERLTADQEEYIRKLFMSATVVYDRFRKSTQPNWPGGYAYFLRCLLILLGWDEIAAHFPVQLAGRNGDKEELRRKIWAVLKWENVPSVAPLSHVRLPDGTFLDGSLLADADRRCTIVSRGYEELLT
jgi:hypothetical protein